MTLKVGHGQLYTLLKLRHLVGNLHAKLEDPSFIITRVIMYNAKLSQWPLATLKVGQGKQYTYWNFAFC